MSQDVEHEGKQISVRRNYRGSGLTVWVHYSGEQRERNRERKDYESAIAEAEKELAALVQTPEAYREQVASLVAGAIEACAFTYCDGYRYAPEVGEDIQEKAAELLEVLRSGRTLLCAERRNARIAQIKAKTAAADPGLQTFLSSLQAGLDEPAHTTAGRDKFKVGDRVYSNVFGTMVPATITGPRRRVHQRFSADQKTDSLFMYDLKLDHDRGPCDWHCAEVEENLTLQDPALRRLLQAALAPIKRRGSRGTECTRRRK